MTSDPVASLSGARALVTGGGGFLGKAIVTQLLEAGCRARSFSRGDYPDLAAMGVETIRGDIANGDAVARACEGCDLVFHVAAKPGVWGRYKEYFRANVTGTRNVIDACARLGIGRLIYTSSPSVVFDGSDIEGADESLPYPASYKAHYPRTKAEAERYVLAANSEGLATVALRPHLVWGPGDNHLTPRLVGRARAGQLRVVGDGRNLVDTVYVDNAARAHLLAAERLAPGSAPAGKAYFISQGEPVELWSMVNRILGAAGLAPLKRSISAGAAYHVGSLLEAVYALLRIKAEPRMTRFLARELSTSHWFDISAARRDLGYEPEVSMEEGLQRLAAWFAREGREATTDAA